MALLLIQENKREPDQETAQAGFRLASNEQHYSGGQGLATWLWQHSVHIYHYAGEKTLQFSIDVHLKVVYPDNQYIFFFIKITYFIMLQ